MRRCYRKIKAMIFLEARVIRSHFRTFMPGFARTYYTSKFSVNYYIGDEPP